MRGVLSCLAIAILPLAFNPAIAQNRDESVRAATFNAFLLSPMFKCFNWNAVDCLLQITGETEQWANHLADTILADPDRFDIIAINEAWDEDAKSILVRRLSPTYPNFVRKIDADLIQHRGPKLQDILQGQPPDILEVLFPGFPIEKINGEDSGMMLFANRKFTFLPLPNPVAKWGTQSDQTLEATTSEVAFTLFGSCGAEDCFAAKGAALVRLRHLPSGRIYNVVFSHTQADYPKDDDFFETERGAQLVAIRKLIEKTLEPLSDREQRERVLVMGDLNVNGRSQAAPEWTSLFNTPGSFFTEPLYDSWARTTSSQDSGITNENDLERLDYILAFPRPYQGGRREGPMCVQHLTIPTDFQDLESDHYMVHADLNVGFFHCHPRIAYEVTLQKPPNPNLPPQEFAVIDETNGVDVTRIEYPGSMQWFHVKVGEPGTYTLETIQQQVQFDVYAPQNLTIPISRYNKTTAVSSFGDLTIYADTYVLPEEFYVRAKGTSRPFTGDYMLTIRRHTCSSPAEACLLQPGQRQTAILTKAGDPVGVQNQAWFRFDVTGTSDGGIDQTVTLTADGLTDPNNQKATLQNFTNTSGIGQPVTQQAGSNRVFVSQMGDGSHGYLVIEQPAPGADQVKVGALMDTNIRFLDVLNLTCEDETNPEFGSDDIFTEFTVDGITTRYPGSGEVEFDCDEPRDEKQWAPVVGKQTITFINQMGMRVLEEDDVSPNDLSRFKVIPSLGPVNMFIDARTDPLIWNFEAGEYRFTFTLRKRKNEPVK